MRPSPPSVAKLSLSLLIFISAWVPLEAQPIAALRIVVVEGEDAVNIIQQKTAVAPVVEVRDRNDQPVAGAVVNFAIRSGRATFGGARTLTVTTNAAGRAVAAGFAPSGTGALQIGATATFQGQAATAVTIAQTTVQTAAQAAAVSGASGAGAGGTGGGASAGAGAGAGGGGGLSATTIGIIGGAVAGGVVAAKELGVIGGGKVYKADFSGTLLMFFPGNPTCPRNEDQSGTVTIELSEDTSAVRGTAKVDGDLTYNGQPCAFGSIGPRPGGRDSFGTDGDATVGGTAGALTFDARQSNNFTESNGASGVNSYIFTFTGALNGSEITGTLTIRREIGGPIGTAGNGVGTIAYNVTLR